MILQARKRRSRGGMTLIELMISLSISTALLSALGAAFYASSRAVEVNDSYFRSTQAARIAVNKIETEVRCADAVKVAPDGASVQVIRSPDRIEKDEILREFSYDASRKRLTLQVFHADDKPRSTYELADHVTACTLEWVQGATPSSGCVSIRITCSIGENAVTLTGAATPRRAIPR